MIPENILTIYGRRPVYEAIKNQSINVWRLHLATSNKPTKELDKIVKNAKNRNVTIHYHTKRELSFISKNGRQDQGIACDIQIPEMEEYREYLKNIKNKETTFLFAIDNVTNPQNLVMIIRSLTASNCGGIIVTRQMLKNISPLTIKASAGAIFKSKLIYCHDLSKALRQMKKHGLEVYALCPTSEESLETFKLKKTSVFILGNESKGISDELVRETTGTISIPLMNGIESLNVAVSAAIVAFAIQRM